jgi:hypothetical protein
MVTDETQWLVRGWAWLIAHPRHEQHSEHHAAWFARFARHEQTHPGAFAAAAREVRW